MIANILNETFFENAVRDNLNEILKSPILRAFALESVDRLIQTGSIGDIEKESMDQGYDYIRNGVKVELKTVSKRDGNRMIISEFDSKRGMFDIMRIIDVYNKRIFEVPHDEFFECYESGKDKNKFRWNADYDDNYGHGFMKSKLKLLKKYEVYE